MTRLPIVLAVTGASGAPYAVRLLEVLATNQVPTWLIVSGHGWRLLQQESGIADAAALQQATGGDWSTVTHFTDEDRGAKPASGSQPTAGMESFFHSLKVERVDDHQYVTRAEAEHDLADYIERFYNRQRRHSTLGYLSPVMYELRSAA